MTPDPDEMRTEWTPERFLDEWTSRARLHQSMVGTLYPPIVAREMDEITAACIERFKTSPEGLLDTGIVYATVQDSVGIVHSYTNYRRCYITAPIEPVDRSDRMVTCLRCLRGR